MNENMNRFAFNTEGKICDYGEEEPKVLTEQEILEELNHLENTKNHFWEECEDVNWQNECLQEEVEQILNMLYPIGDIFMSLDKNNSPDKMFGKWRYLGIKYGAYCWARIE